MYINSRKLCSRCWAVISRIYAGTGGGRKKVMAVRKGVKRCALKKIKSIEIDDECSELGMQGTVKSLCSVVLTICKR